jgi:1,4-dihydroxy-2-naphthoate octaprenyltransferase
MRMQKSMCITVNLFIYSFSVLVLGEASDHDYIHLFVLGFLCVLCTWCTW